MNKNLILIVFWVLFSVKVAFGQSIPGLVKLPSPDSLSNSDFQYLKPNLKGKRIVLAGEASHGGKEFFTIKQALLKYLADEEGFRHFALEENVAICEKFNDYVAGKISADPRLLAKEAYYTWPYHTEEFSNFLKWMRDYNKNKSAEKKIKFWGTDMQFAYQSMGILILNVNQINKKHNLSIPNVPRQKQYFYKAPDSLLMVISQTINNLKGSEKKDYLLRHLAVVKMKNTYISLQREGLYPTKSSSRFRDSCMAANVESILSYIGKKEKIMYWAHNAHIAKSIDSVHNKYTSGSFLKRWHPEDAYFIGFDFDSGNLLLNYKNTGLKSIEIRPKEDQSFARFLDKLNYKLLFIPFSSSNSVFFSKPLKMRDDIFLVEKRAPDLYDAIFFLKKVNATKRLE